MHKTATSLQGLPLYSLRKASHEMTTTITLLKSIVGDHTDVFIKNGISLEDLHSANIAAVSIANFAEIGGNKAIKDSLFPLEDLLEPIEKNGHAFTTPLRIQSGCESHDRQGCPKSYSNESAT